MSFKKYMTQVDNEMNKVCGHTHHMLADFRYMDHFEDEFPPRETALAALIEDFGFRKLAEMAHAGEINCTVDELAECC